MPFCLQAQLQKERRVYYLDASYSMHKPNKIWDAVKADLMKAIRNVEDETTELVVFPFSDAKHDHTPHAELATEAGKQRLIAWVDGYEYHDRNCKTVHNLPMSDFFANRANDDRITYMFFMTDGENEQEVKEFNDKLSAWGERYGDRTVYGFYVMLHQSARNAAVEKIVAEQPHLWLVNSADVNIRIARVQSQATFNVRNDSYLEMPIVSKTAGYKVEASIADDDYRVTRSEIVDGKLRVYIEGNGDISTLPEKKSVSLSLNCQKTPDQFSFWVSDKVKLTVLNQKERTLKISVK